MAGACITLSAAAGSADTDWERIGRNSDMQHYSPLSAINEQTALKLGVAWSAEMPSKDGLSGNPLVKDGVVYQGGPGGNIYANDLRTGRLLWHFKAEPKYDEASMTSYWSIRHNRGVAIEGENVIIALGDCRLIAANRKTGQQAWEVESCDRKLMYGITAAPRVGGGLVFTGNNCGDTGLQRGYVEAFDAKTGTRRWRTYTVPGDPSKAQETPVLEMAAKTWGEGWYDKTKGCGSVWEAITYDEKLNLLYVGTGGPAPWSPADRGKNAGDELFTNSILALRADTGEYVWHYKVVPNDGWNLEPAMHIMVAELPVDPDGTVRRVVMTAPKNGFFYVLDAATGKFMSANNFVPVTWAKGINQKTGRPIPNKDSHYWERPGKRVVVSPGPYGAHNWQAMSLNPATGLVYFPSMTIPTTMKVDPKSAVGGVMFDMMFGASGDPKWKAFGELVAWDPVKQKAAWKVRRSYPINGGTLSTGGNVVFQGTADGKFEAYSADGGKLLYSYQLDGSIQAAPTTVEVDGEQLVLVPSGNGGSSSAGMFMAKFGVAPNAGGPARLTAFKLGGTGFVAPPQEVAFPQPPLPRPSKTLAKRGELLYERNVCVDCHGQKVGTGNGSVPDLRRSNVETYELFAGIVLGGLRADKGMPRFSDLTMDDAAALQAYILEMAWKTYDAQKQAERK